MRKLHRLNPFFWKFKYFGLTFSAIIGIVMIATVVPAANAQADCPGGNGVDHKMSVYSLPNCTNLAPSNALWSVRNQVVGGYWIAYDQWLSVAGSPLENTINIDSGTTVVPLQFNAISYRAQYLRVRSITYVIGASVNGDGYGGQPVGGSFAFDYPSQDGAYRVAAVDNNGVFNLSLPAQYTTPGTHIINLALSTKATQLSSNGKWVCVAINNPSHSVNGPWDYGSCETGSLSATIQVIVHPKWTINTSAGVNKTTAAPSDTLQWTHKVWNDGPDAVDKTITSRYWIDSNGIDPAEDSQQVGRNSGRNIGSEDTGLSRTFNSTYTITQDDVGHSVCRRTSASPRAWNDSGWIDSNAACANIPYSYSLTTSVDLNNAVVAEAGSSVNNVKGTVTNSGPTKSYPSDSVFTRVVFPASTSISEAESKGGAASTATSCDYYGGSQCQTWAADTNKVYGAEVTGKITNTTYNSSLGTDTIPDVAVGSRVCYGLSVRGHNAATGASKSESYYSKLKCLTVGKKPKVQVYGGDTIVGRNDVAGSTHTIQTSVTSKNVTDDTYKAPQVLKTSEGLCVDSNDDEGTIGATPYTSTNRIQLWGCLNDSQRQQFTIQYVSGNSGPFYIKSGAFTNKCLDVPAGYTQEDTTRSGDVGAPFYMGDIWFYNCNGGKQQTWQWSTTAPGKTRIQFVYPQTDNDNKMDSPRSVPICLDIPSGNQVQGQTLRIYSCNATDAQVFQQADQGTNSTATHTVQQTYGSWDEYGLFASGGITGMASASGLAGGVGSTAGVCDYSLLTFANLKPLGTGVKTSSCDTTGNTLGRYTVTSAGLPINSMFSNTAASATPPTIDTSSPANRTVSIYNYSGTADLALNAMTIPKNRTIVLRAPNAAVTITKNITLQDTNYTSIDQIPQIIIIAKNINIQSSVTQVDAWLAATTSDKNGTINTCSDAPTQLTASDCANGLTVNGPVIVDSLKLRRTAGSGTGTASGDPAEVFNLPASTLLWARAQAQQGSVATTTSQTELPPRF